MSSLPARAMTPSNHNRMGSNAITDIKQGGGSKKAGFPYQIGRTSWTPIYLQSNNYGVRCCKLSTLQFTANPNVRQSRPTGSRVEISYWRNGANY